MTEPDATRDALGTEPAEAVVGPGLQSPEAEAELEDEDEAGAEGASEKDQSRLARTVGGVRTRVGTFLRGASPRVVGSLVLLLIVALTLVGWQWRRSGALAGELRSREEVARVAGDLGVALLSYDYRSLPDARAAILRNATDEFRSNYDETLEAGLRTIITKLKATARATLRDVYVSELSADRAKAIAVLDSNVRSTAGVRRLRASYLEMELVRDTGAWKVSAVTAVAAASETIDRSAAAPPPPKP